MLVFVELFKTLEFWGQGISFEMNSPLRVFPVTSNLQAVSILEYLNFLPILSLPVSRHLN